VSGIALVTPTYGPDLPRCELLVESVRRCSPDTRHYLIVDRRDGKRFAHLAGANTILVTSEDLLPKYTFRVPGPHSIWLSPGCIPTRGWMMQQIRKIACAANLDESAAVFVDSDVAFIRPFVLEELFDLDRCELLDVDFTNPEMERWTRTACALLGLDDTSLEVRGHVGSLVCWKTAHVRAMVTRVEEIARRDWRRALMNQRSFSEYVLYGAYVRGVLGLESSGHVPSKRPLDKHSWGMDLSSPKALTDFLSDFDPQTIAVMVHSKDPIDLNRYRSELRRIWDTV
jgi:hypothetical protein